MKKIKTAMFVTMICILLFCSMSYFLIPQEYKWAIRSVIDVPICASRVTNKLNINPGISELKNYMISSLKLGMTPDEVKKTLEKIAPIYIKNTFIDNEQELNTEILVKICDNPYGNIVFFVYYSKDKHLINVVDAYAE